ncbi:MAG: elongation factor Ts [Gemmatimonadaceae bacterium]|nr:elongation factor Ts [Gemmatimonadaceae bacterium]
MAITAKDVADLRARTGAGMMDCKKALEEAAGDITKAIEILRMKGITKAEKRAGRSATEGRIVVKLADHGQTASIIEVNSETDFVARNDEFGTIAHALAEHVFADSALDSAVHNAAEGTVLGQAWHQDQSRTVADVVKEASAKTGENVVFRRYARFATDGVIGHYVHFNGKVAAVVDVTGANNAAARELAKSVAEHVAAGVPRVPYGVTRDDVPKAFVEKEREIFTAQAKESGKPDNIVARMVDGQVNKLYAEAALLEQPWVRDPNMSIKQLVEQKAREGGSPLAIRRFVRYQMGEE